MANYSVTINGVERDCRLSAFTIQTNLNRVPTFLGEFISEDASFRPLEDDEIVITEDTGVSPVEIIFAGLIEAPEESAVDGQVADDIDSITTRVEAAGYSTYADWRYVDIALPAGTLKSMLVLLEPFLDDYGVVLDPLQVDGPDLEGLDYSASPRKLTDVLNDISSLSTGSGGSPDIPFVWEIDFEKTLRMYQLGSRTAPTDLIEGDGVEVGDLVIRRSTRHTANRVILRSGNGALTTIANDTVAQGSPPIIKEALIETAADLPQATATQAANGLLQQFSLVQREARFSTRRFGYQVGQLLGIQSPKRNIPTLTQFLITEVVTRQDPDNLALRRWITAIEGYRLQGSWMDILSRWSTGVGGVGTIGLPGAGGIGSVPGGGAAGGGADCDCCEAKCAGETLLFTGYGSEGDWQFLSTKGVDLGPIPNPVSETSSGVRQLTDGTVVVTGASLGTAFYPADFSSATFPTDAVNIQRAMSLDTAENIYGYKAGSPDVIRKVNSAGTLVADYSVGSNTSFIYATGVNTNGSKIYFVATDYTVGPRTKKEVYVLDTGTLVVSLFASEATFQCDEHRILVLPTSGDVIIAWKGSGTNGYVKRYNSAGTLQATYSPTFNGLGWSPESIQPGLTELTFWCAAGANVTTPNNGIVVAEIDVATGDVLNQFIPENGTPFYFGGPFMLLRTAIPS